MNTRSRNKKTDTGPSCPCGTRASIEQCCAPRIDGQQPAETAEALMRSRYTAFTQKNAPYLLASWHPDTRPAEITFDPIQRWLGLKILAREQGSQQDTTGIVEFVARYKVNSRAHRLHELSRFERVAGHWVYVDGDLNDDDS